jgi:hypothetical protein
VVWLTEPTAEPGAMRRVDDALSEAMFEREIAGARVRPGLRALFSS